MTLAEYTTTTSAATPIEHETATVQREDPAMHVGLNMHAELPVDQKEDFIRMVANSCVVNFIDTYRGSKTKKCEVV